MYFIWYIITGIIAGFVAGKIMRGGGFGLIVNLLLGIVGGVLGGWIFGLLGIPGGGIIGGLASSIVGAVLLLWIASMFRIFVIILHPKPLTRKRSVWSAFFIISFSVFRFFADADPRFLRRKYPSQRPGLRSLLPLPQ